MTDYELGYQDGKEAGYEQRDKELIHWDCEDNYCFRLVKRFKRKGD